MVEILYEDENILVINKPYGLDSQKEVPELLHKQLGYDILPIHRLDKTVTGLIVYGKNSYAVNEITKQIQSKQFHKEYLAVTSQLPPKQSDTLIDLLFHDRQKNKTYVVKRERKGVKKAILSYTLLDYSENKALLLIKPETGRTHQIRIQLANIKLPLVGDGKYGSKENCHCALFAYHLSFNNPKDNSIIDLRIKPNHYPFNLFNLEKIL